MIENSPSAEDDQILIAAHREVVDAASRIGIESLAKRLSSLPTAPEGTDREIIGRAVVRTIQSEARQPVAAADRFPRSDCRTLDRPVFTISSPTHTGSQTFAAANAAEGTLEVDADAGRSSPSEGADFLGMAYNTATASIGARLALPPHPQIPGQISELTVTVEVRVESLWYPTASGSDLVELQKGSGELPWRGLAIAECKVGLTILGADGSSARTQVGLVSSWVNHDGPEAVVDHAPDGVLTLSAGAIVAPGLTDATIFVDTTCHAFAERSTIQGEPSAYAQLQCRKDGTFPPPSQLRLVPQQTEVVLCERALLAPPN